MKLLPITELQAGMVLAEDVYVRERDPTAFLLRNSVLTEKNIERMKTVGIGTVHVRTPGGEEPALQVAPPMQDMLRKARQRGVRPTPVIKEELRREALSSLEKAFSEVWIDDSGIHGGSEAVERLETVVGSLVRALGNNRKTLLSVQELKSFDDYTYHHSLSVAVLSIGIGHYLGLETAELNQLGLAAIMHDIGKVAVPIDILNKPTRLEASEFELIKGHSSAGTSYLMDSSMGNEALWRAVLFHHERVDGKGYPAGISGTRIPVWSRVISVADVYDALTSNRPYRKALPPSEAMEYLMGGIDAAFDYDVVNALLHKAAPYPVGCCVELSTGQLACVKNNENRMRPLVELLDTGDEADLQSDRRYLSVVIRRVIPESEIAAVQ